MEPTRNPEYLHGLIARMTEFREAFEAYLALHFVINAEDGVGALGHIAGLSPAAIRRDDVTAVQVSRAADRVARLSGRIAHVAGLTGATVLVEGTGAIDPFVNALSVTRPKPVVEPRDVLNTCEYAIGRLEGMLALAEAEAAPSIDAAGLHPTIWGAASALWRDGHRRRAVSAAAEALIAVVKARIDRYDIADTAVWHEALSSSPPQLGRARLRWPGDPAHLTVKSIQEGLRQFAPGAQLLIRNPATHDEEELSEPIALEQLGALSLLARRIDGCELIEVDEPAPREDGAGG